MSILNPEDYLNRYPGKNQIMLIGPMGCSPQKITDPVLFVDGGANWRESGVGYSVGDGDSYHGTLDLLLDSDKDFSDLSFALGLLGEQFTNIILLGFLGGRRDHELLNLGEVFHFLKRRPTLTKVSLEQSVIAISTGSWQLNLHGIFSLVAFEPTAVTLSGQCKYQVESETLVKPVSSFGLSNEGFGQVSIVASSPLLIFCNE